MKTYLHIVVLLSLMVVGCARTVDDRVEEVVDTPSLLKLSAIDSLMWKEADSALAVMMEFTNLACMNIALAINIKTAPSWASAIPISAARGIPIWAISW